MYFVCGNIPPPKPPPKRVRIPSLHIHNLNFRLVLALGRKYSPRQSKPTDSRPQTKHDQHRQAHTQTHTLRTTLHFTHRRRPLRWPAGLRDRCRQKQKKRRTRTRALGAVSLHTTQEPYILYIYRTYQHAWIHRQRGTPRTRGQSEKRKRHTGGVGVVPLSCPSTHGTRAESPAGSGGACPRRPPPVVIVIVRSAARAGRRESALPRGTLDPRPRG